MLSDIASEQESVDSSPPKMPSQIATTKARYSSTLFDTLKRKWSGISNLNARPVFTEKPPMPASQESVTKIDVGCLSTIRLIDMPALALLRNLR